MSSVSAPASSSSRRGLRWWQWLAFALPGLVAVGTTWAMTSLQLARHPDDPHSHLLLGTGLAGLIAGGIACVVCGIILGLTTPVHRRVLACIGWTLLCALTNLPVAFAGCSIIESTLLR